MQESIEQLEAKVKQNFDRTPYGKAHKKHVEFFGVAPITYSRGPHNQNRIQSVMKAIETGVPYDERRGKTEEELSRMY
tara:strand:+ start:1481 stop:1714 length:234 start_codon:yes stop_codon:yes gene_type:complete